MIELSKNAVFLGGVLLVVAIVYYFKTFLKIKGECRILSKSCEEFPGLNGQRIQVFYINILFNQEVIKLQVDDIHQYDAIEEFDEGKVIFRAGFLISFRKNDFTRREII